MDIWIFGIFRFLGNWKKIIKVVFALVRSGKDKDKYNKETGCLLTTATLSGLGRGKKIDKSKNLEVEDLPLPGVAVTHIQLDLLPDKVVHLVPELISGRHHPWVINVELT